MTGATRTLFLLAFLACSAGAADTLRYRGNILAASSSSSSSSSSDSSSSDSSDSSDCEQHPPSTAEADDDPYPAYPSPEPTAAAPTAGEPDVGGGGGDNEDGVTLAYLGCFEESIDFSFNYFVEDDNITPATCSEHCTAESALYLGLLGGNFCACGDDPAFLDVEVTEAVCGEPCSGDASATCGGDRAYDIYKLDDGSQPPAPAPVSDPVPPTLSPATEPTPTVPDGPATSPAPIAPPVGDGGGGGEDLCSNGILGIQSGHACCLAECGACGGPGCAQLGGGLGADKCCQSEIEDEGEACTVTLAAPCVVDGGGDAPAPSPVVEPTAPPAPADDGNDEVCSNGIPGIQSGHACCPVECGACGGPGCAQLGGGLGADKCCQSEIEDEGEACTATLAAPCVVDGADEVCSNGIPGIQSGHACCPVECGACGGPGCAQLGGGLGADKCCQSEIEDEGELCDVTLEAPCVVDEPDEVCSNGIPGIQSGHACCPVECGACGGPGCAQLGGGLGADKCCQSEIEDEGELCEVTLEAPCVVDGADQVCSNGIPGIQSGHACCPVECGACGGPGCAQLGGGLGSENCCQSEIEDEGELCDVTMAAPCVVDDGEDCACSNGIPGIQSGNACCPVECGACGGPGCAQLGGGLGADKCCQSEIEHGGESCAVTLGAPCVVEDDGDAPAPSPVEEPTAPPAPTDDDVVCSNGIPGIQSGHACCLAECGACGGLGCALLGGGLGADKCCQSEIEDGGELCDVTLAAPCALSGGTEAPTPAATDAPTAVVDTTAPATVAPAPGTTMAPASVASAAPATPHATRAPVYVATASPTTLPATLAPAHAATATPMTLPVTLAPAHVGTASPTTLPATLAPAPASTAAPTTPHATTAPATVATAAPMTLPATLAPVPATSTSAPITPRATRAPANVATAAPMSIPATTAPTPVSTVAPMMPSATTAPAPLSTATPTISPEPTPVSTSQPVQEGGEETSGTLEFMIPLYTLPLNFEGELVGQWALLKRTADAGKSVVGIVNPENGPTVYDETYVIAMDEVVQAGAKLVCYVPTAFGETEERTVTDSVFAYNAQYPGYCDGIFFDETPTFLDGLEGLYGNYNAAVHTIFDAGGTGTRVIFNPGVSADDTYYTAFSPPVEVVGFENDYDSFDEEGVVPDVSSNSTVGSNILLVHSAAALADNEGLIPDFVEQAYCKGWDSIYVTDDIMPNPFDEDPSFWDAVLAAESAPKSC